MVDLAKKSEYRDHIRASIDYAKKYYWPRCAVLREYWRNSYVPDDVIANSEFVTSAVIKPVVEAQVSALVPKNPKTRVIPRKQFFDSTNGKVVAEKTTRLVESICDFDIEQTGAREEWRRAVRDGRLLGLGATEQGWDPWIDKSPIVKRTIESSSDGLKTEKTETNLRYQEYIRKASPFLRYRRAEDVLLPAYCMRAEDAPFIVVLNWRLLSEIKADPNYDLTEEEKQSLSSRASLSWMDFGDGRQKPDTMEREKGYDKMACEFHLWHKADDVYAVFIDGMDEPVRWDDEWPFPKGAAGIDGFPVKLYIPLPDDTMPYGLPPAKDLIPQQQEKNKIRSKMADKVSKWKDITLAGDDVDPAETDRIKRAEEGSLVSVQDPRRYVPLQAQMESLNALLAYEARIADDIRTQSAVSDYQLSKGAGVDLATEAALIAQGTAARVEDDKTLVSRFMAEGVKCMFQLRQQLTPGEESIRITGERGVEWLSYTADNITGEYDFQMTVEDRPSDRLQSRDDARLELEAMYGKPEVDGTALLRDVAKKLRIPEEVIRGTAKFAARREAEYENEILKTEMGQIVRPHPEEDFETHLMAHMDEAQREQEAVGQVNPALVAHIQQTQAMQNITFGGGENGKGSMPGMIDATTGQMRTSGAQKSDNPVEKVKSGDVGALRGVQAG